MRPSAATESDHGDGAPARDRGAARPSGALTQVARTLRSRRARPDTHERPLLCGRRQRQLLCSRYRPRARGNCARVTGSPKRHIFPHTHSEPHTVTHTTFNGHFHTRERGTGTTRVRHHTRETTANTTPSPLHNHACVNITPGRTSKYLPVCLCSWLAMITAKDGPYGSATACPCSSLSMSIYIYNGRAPGRLGTARRPQGSRLAGGRSATP